jgi:hypothetical protein
VANSSKNYRHTGKTTDTGYSLRRKPLKIQRFVTMAKVAARPCPPAAVAFNRIGDGAGVGKGVKFPHAQIHFLRRRTIAWSLVDGGVRLVAQFRGGQGV